MPLLLSSNLDRSHAQSGGARNRWLAARIALTIEPVTATSASWKMMARAWIPTRRADFFTILWDLAMGDAERFLVPTNGAAHAIILFQSEG